MRRGIAAVCLALAASVWSPAHAGAFLFDATKNEMAGNADWVLDADAWDRTLPAYPCSGSTNESRPSRFPTPAASGIVALTPETYWTGGISAWAVDLVKAGHTVETLPPGAAITFGDTGNPQDLGNYDVYVVVEPQAPFTAAEKTAILAFIAAGGGLFMVGDHETSDRDCDGWDSPHVWNDLTGAVSASSAGVFGIWFRVNGLEDQGGEDWFDDAVDANVETDPSDPIVSGPFGSGSGGLGLFGSTSMDLNPTDNSTVRGHVWRTGQAHGAVRVTFATASYGAGRVAAIGDSSPADDDTGDPADNLHPGWDKAAGGVRNREIHLNACAWLLNPAPDTSPPAITAGPVVSPADCSAVVTWTTDEAATSLVDYGSSPAYGAQASAPSHVQSHAVALTPLSPSTLHHYRVSSSDVAGNGPTQSADATFTTAPPAPPSISSGPAVVPAATSATVTWTTDEPSTSVVEYGLTAAYGQTASGPSGVTSHVVQLSGLTPEATHHFRVLSADACGHGPTASGDGTFGTTAPSMDLSGWVLEQYDSTQTWTLPSGTTLPRGPDLARGHLDPVPGRERQLRLPGQPLGQRRPGPGLVPRGGQWLRGRARAGRLPRREQHEQRHRSCAPRRQDDERHRVRRSRHRGPRGLRGERDLPRDHGGDHPGGRPVGVAQARRRRGRGAGHRRQRAGLPRPGEPRLPPPLLAAREPSRIARQRPRHAVPEQGGGRHAPHLGQCRPGDRVPRLPGHDGRVHGGEPRALDHAERGHGPRCRPPGPGVVLSRPCHGRDGGIGGLIGTGAVRNGGTAAESEPHN